MQTLTRRVLVSGLVQGVFYRASTVEQALARGLDGWVRNLTDGRVEALVSGPEAKVTELLAWMERGPPDAQVEQVLASDADAPDGQGFVVRGTAAPA